MASHFESPLREPLINGNKTYKDITNDIVRPTTGKIQPKWLFWTSVSAAVAGLFVITIWSYSATCNGIIICRIVIGCSIIVCSVVVFVCIICYSIIICSVVV